MKARASACTRLLLIVGIGSEVSVGLFGPGPANAQSAPATPTTSGSQTGMSSSSGGNPSAADEVSEIVVTGTRIAHSRDYIASSPIVTVNSDALGVAGQTAVGEALNQLPEISAGYSSTSQGQTGANQAGRTLADLRGLGAARTLVLVDGERVEPSDSFNRVDLSIIPTSLIDDVEIITGGASAVYGSDALAGVINLKLKKNLDGLYLGGQYGGTTDGGGQQYDGYATFGANFADQHGNVVFSFEYSKRDAIDGQQRPQFLDTAEYPGIVTGQVVLSAPNAASQAAIDQVFSGYGIAPGTVSPLSNFGFNRDGTLFAGGPGGAGANLKPDPTEQYLRVGNTLQGAVGDIFLVQSPLDKYTFFSKANYELAPQIQAYSQGFFSTYRTDFVIPSLEPVSVPVTNPFIPAGLQTLLASRPAPGAPFNYSTISQTLPVVTIDTASVWQYNGGVRGALGIKDWTFDIGGSVGRSTTTEQINGLPNAAAFSAAANAPDGGASLCSGGLNLFPFVSLSQDCRGKLLQNTTSTTEVYQRYAEASAQGALVRIPDGDVRFSAGVDYRINGFKYNPDSALQTNPLTGTNAVNDVLVATVAPAGGSTSVTEEYLELSVPILAHRPFAEELSLDGAYRSSDYNISGRTGSFKLEGTWAPLRALRFRGGYQRALRAPSPGELFASELAGTGNIGATAAGAGDPCAVNSVQRTGANASQVRALCLAQGLPSAIVDTYTNTATIAGTRTAGNTSLKPEIGNSASAGVVLQSVATSPWASGLSVSVDYYDIKVTQAVGTLTASQELDNCFNIGGGNPTYSPSNPYCQLISRFSGQTGTLGSINYIQTPTLNLARYEVSGIDTTLNWALDLKEVTPANLGRLTLNTILSYQNKYDIQNSAGSPVVNYIGTIGNNQISGFSHPHWKTVTTLTYVQGPAQGGFRWRYVSSMRNALDLSTGTVNGGTPSVSYFDLFGAYDVGHDVMLHGGMTNVFDKKPPFYSNSYPYTDPATFDIVGRSFYVRADVKL